jgi:hypothetical protein
MGTTFSNPQALAERGEKIYQAKFKKDFEAKYDGQFVVIDVKSEAAYVGKTPEAAYEAATKAAPNGLFHLIKVGSAGAFRVSYTSHGNVDWVFRV